MLYNGAYLCFMVNYRCLQNRSSAWCAQKLHHRPSKIYRLSRINHLRVAYLIHYLEKWRRSLWCRSGLVSQARPFFSFFPRPNVKRKKSGLACETRSGRVEAIAVTMCHGKLNCWPINSIYRFNLKVPARPINAKHTLCLLLSTVKTSANKIIY